MTFGLSIGGAAALGAAASAVGTGVSAGMSAKGQSAANAATKRAAENLMHSQQNALEQANLGTGRAIKQLLPWYDAGKAALPEYQAAAMAPAYNMDQFNAQNGTSLSLAEMLRAYSPEQYQREWGQDPRQYLQQGNFQASPDYAWRKQQGMEGIQQSAAGRGSLLSGATLKALNNYNSNLASQEYGNWFNRDMQNRQMGLGNYWQASQADTLNRNMQLGEFNNGANRNQQRVNNLGQLVGMGQNAASNRAQFAYGNGQTLAGMVSGAGSNLANLNLQQGMNSAQNMNNLNNSIQGGLANALTLYGMYGRGGGQGGGSPWDSRQPYPDVAAATASQNTNAISGAQRPDLYGGIY